MIQILTFTTLYPDSTRPAHGVFVENRLRHLLAAGHVSSRVVAPVPWFPFQSAIFGNFARYCRVPAHEFRLGIDVAHPRYPLIPACGMSTAPWLMAMAVKPLIQRTIAGGYNFDIIDAHYFYPDGVAAAILGRLLHKPVVITARGTDINYIPRYYWPRRMILWASCRAAAIITVCEALKNTLVNLGVSENKITVLRNGVDLHTFKPPEDRDTLRASLGMKGPTLLSVGGLIPRKGHDRVILALRHLPEASLSIIGEGPERNKLETLARENGLGDRITFLGRVEHNRLPDHYGAADLLVLASSREGWANVLWKRWLVEPRSSQPIFGVLRSGQFSGSRRAGGQPRSVRPGAGNKPIALQPSRPLSHEALCGAVRLESDHAGPDCALRPNYQSVERTWRRARWALGYARRISARTAQSS